MDAESKYGPKISSFFTPENIEILNDPVDLDLLVLKLLENLGLNYGIGNVHNIFTHSYKRKDGTKEPVVINSSCLLFHFRIPLPDDPRIAIAIPRKGVFNIPSGSPENIKVVFVVTSPMDKPDLFLKIAKSLKEFFTNDNKIESLVNQVNSAEIWNYFDQSSISLPDIIYAGDIMDELKVYLNESNNLKDAIDKIVKTGSLNIPVIDLEGNLIGEVTSHELMEVCLPRYILWMNDITPIVNFEPFQNMLAHEENTWLTEIMNFDYAKVQKNDPFMEAGIVMTKKSASQTYVLDDKKLVGIITLQFFLDKILRE